MRKEQTCYPECTCHPEDRPDGACRRRYALSECIATPVERIVAAAIQVQGITMSLPLPARHGQVLHAADDIITQAELHGACQGFLTSTGRFVNRVQAKQIAHMAGQPQLRPESHRTKDLYSEDLW